jgi:hypothetical protein
MDQKKIDTINSKDLKLYYNETNLNILNHNNEIKSTLVIKYNLETIKII